MSEHSVRYVLIHSETVGGRYRPHEAASVAEVTLQELERCLDAGLLSPLAEEEGAAVFSQEDIERLAQIRRLQQEVDLDYDAIEVVLHLRDQLLDMQREMMAQREAMLRREQMMLQTIHELRRQLAMDSDWW